VILAKTVKGYGMGSAGEALNPTHQTKKLDDDAVRFFRDRFNIPVDDAQLKDGAVPFYHPGEKSDEIQYMLERRRQLGGFLPQRRRKSTQTLTAPKLDAFERLLGGSGEREMSTTMAFVQSLNIILRDKQVGPRCVPHLRHGRLIPPDRYLRPGRAKIQAGGPRPTDVLPRR